MDSYKLEVEGNTHDITADTLDQALESAAQVMHDNYGPDTRGTLYYAKPPFGDGRIAWFTGPEWDLLR